MEIPELAPRLLLLGHLAISFPQSKGEVQGNKRRSKPTVRFVSPAAITWSPFSQRQPTQPSPSPPSGSPLPSPSHQRACPVQLRAHRACKPSSPRLARTSCLF